MTDPGRAINNKNLIREMLAAWVVTLAAAIGLSLLAFQEARTDGRTAPRWHARPIADAEEADEDLSAPRGADWTVRQSTGGSAAYPPAE